jgi:cell shape-determining protein MreD
MEHAGTLVGSRVFASVIPVTLALLGVVIANLPVSFLGGFVPAPLLGLMPIYFWGLVRPDLMPPFWAFAAGVLEDVLSGGPPGVWTVSFIVTFALIDRQRDAFAGLAGVWAILGFATAATLCCATAYTVEALIFWRLPPFAPVMGELAMSVIFYVLIAMFFGFIQRRLVGPLRGDF